MGTVSLREFGRMRGVSGEAVRKAIASGRLVRSVVYDDKKRPSIDPDIAAQEWAVSTHPSQGGKREAGVSQIATEPDQPAPAEEQRQPGAAATFAQSRAVREAYMARLAKLEFEEKSAVLVRVDSVKNEAFKVARQVRDAMLNIPDRVAAELAADTDPFVVHRKLTLEIRKALESLNG